ncbi:flavodoxin and radical SAM domain-containing protein [Histoplasma capsulatum]|uniref:tRNA 4-demethylwyosine synthase (AdoMet-dependent) n=1 Tax=Ajellomyces capsulatus TaxID=5037 RepID=A0A8A1LXL1_AJECA|nr:hypothetical protein HCAG_09003 [Histoplasma mississippiense (nom. inval.)]EDN05367.1 hypothetical protein HCAG_09003 [Histoplasma mississippiense (nom. inval.)]QSS57955.1 flavodoxin and radical SAM domain-containing protein [Histoplasma capsulatum]
MAGDDLQIFAQRLLTSWHRYRIPIFFLAAVVSIVIWLSTRSHKRNTPLSDSLSPCQSEKQNQNDKAESCRVELSSKNDPAAAFFPNSDHSGSSIESQVRQAKQSANGPKRVHGSKPVKRGANNRTNPGELSRDINIQPMVFYVSLTGSTEAYAKSFCHRLQKATHALIENHSKTAILTPQLHDLSYIELDDYFITAPKPPDSAPNTRFFYCILIPTYNIDTMINTFLGHLDDTHNDFRIDTSSLSALAGYSVFGFGDREGWPSEEEGFCSQARDVDRWMAKLTGKKRAYPLGMADVKGGNTQTVLNDWCDGLSGIMFDLISSGGLGEGFPGSGDPIESDEEDIHDSEENDENGRSFRNKRKEEQIVDLEDIKFGVTDGKGTSADRQLLPIDFTTQSHPQASKPVSQPQLEMVPTSSPTFTALTKQGYTIVGSHSGVKICRWTKSALRGRGSCYKNSFYGIKSHLCMETTPSLSCSNKCVFCWRHGTNPVGTTWRWKVDPPDLIFDGVKAGHYKKIKMLRGVPGVRAERFAEAMRIRHCALSLVGEPIFYPHINEFLALLHNEHISSFLVCNAQHPDELAALHRVTQLYVSIDASNRDSLRKIDRPLHRDFWERFQRCLDILREKRYLQRTVYRLTLVKGFNVDEEAVGYADLVEKGLPCFVEVKGVTFCGTSTSASAGITMQNVPFYEEVVAFVVALNAELTRRGLGYGIAAEHKHSCCVLLASNRFYVNDRWHTRIDYDKFFTLLEKEKNNGISFRPEDYMRETDEWALWGNGGFDPNDTRVYTRGKNKAKLNAVLKASEQNATSVEG